MMRLTRSAAEEIVCGAGWLRTMAEPFRKTLLEHAQLQHVSAGDTIFRHGDPPGGIYGHVTGTISVHSGPLDARARPIHLAIPGGWTGEGCFLTGQPRRVELQAVTDASVMHVPLSAMEKMAAQDPRAIRAFAVISMLATETMVRVVYDLQRREVGQRIAAVLHRMCGVPGVSLSLSQDMLAEMTNASRQQVNGSIKRFTGHGWLSTGYRSITIHDPEALLQYAENGV